jgi:hypothetical protein
MRPPPTMLPMPRWLNSVPLAACAAARREGYPCFLHVACGVCALPQPLSPLASLSGLPSCLLPISLCLCLWPHSAYHHHSICYTCCIRTIHIRSLCIVRVYYSCTRRSSCVADMQHERERLVCSPRPPIYNLQVKLKKRGVKFSIWILLGLCPSIIRVTWKSEVGSRKSEDARESLLSYRNVLNRRSIITVTCYM